MITIEEAIQAYKETEYTPVVFNTLIVDDRGICGCLVGVYYAWKENKEITPNNYSGIAGDAHRFIDELYGSNEENWEELGDSGTLGLGFDDGFLNLEYGFSLDGRFTMYDDGYKIGQAVREWYNSKKDVI